MLMCSRALRTTTTTTTTTTHRNCGPKPLQFTGQEGRVLGQPLASVDQHEPLARAHQVRVGTRQRERPCGGWGVGVCVCVYVCVSE